MPKELFAHKGSQVKKQRLDLMPKVTFDQRNSLRASLEVAWLIARAKKPHNIGEKLIKPVATRMTEMMCGKEQAAKLGTVPLSAKTVSKRLDVLAQNIKEQLIISIKKSRQLQ
ncbi:SCAN domain-containing protein 3 [Oopsacas minuta]|uniref:SCAN domain-containing protein 3 n=1 Tax=Oopsacas minuta TaxID=111878 RepID=A0AAV7JTV5_9METZ|nr:SCAN domain-containing protein 3 [Oopsacas minuta]